MAISTAIGSAGAVPIGVVNPFAGATAPSGWLLCFGQAVSRSQYSALFAVLNTTYGAGDGSTTFALPDMRGRAVAGKDDMGGSTAGRITAGTTGVTGTTLGSAGGTQNPPLHNHSNTLTGTTTFASNGHTHAGQGTLAAAIGATNGNPNRIGYVAGTNTGGPGTATYSVESGGLITGTADFNHYTPVYGSTGSNSASASVGIFNNTAGSGTSGNLPPTIILNYIIKAQ